jgi:glycosyltransferase involved in cell wall biosynthesis
VPDPLVSICVRNFNYETFVGQAIESALAQTYPRAEVIAVDDGSTDRSREVIAGFGKRVRAKSPQLPRPFKRGHLTRQKCSFSSWS